LISPTGGLRPTFTALFTEADLNDLEVESKAILDDVGVCSRPWQVVMATVMVMVMATVTATAAAAMDIEGLVGLPDLVNWYVHLLLSFSTSTPFSLCCHAQTVSRSERKGGKRLDYFYFKIKIKFFKF
jgi:hypothetical protein